MPVIRPVILSGGTGSRLWPLSRSQLPKQLLPLVSDLTLIQETLLRTRAPSFARPLIVCSLEHRFLIAEQVREAGVDIDCILLEPCGRNTAPAATIAALKISQSDPEAILLVMPADHLIKNQNAFHRAIERAVDAAVQGHLVAFGITPHTSQTGYGYIQRGSSLQPPGSFAVSRFVEKPDLAKARSYLESGDYYWNSGIFLFRANAFLAELKQHEPDILARCKLALLRGKQDLDFFRLDAAEFAACKSTSIDYAIMEHTKKAAVIPVDMGWSDIGSWEALWAASLKDDEGNAVMGDVLHYQSSNSYLRSEGPTVAAVGLQDMIVIATQDAVLIGAKSAAQDVKEIVGQLEQQGRDLRLVHRKISRPWGFCEQLDRGQNFRVKRMLVNPGAKLAWQKSSREAEHWIVVSGIAQVTCGGSSFQLHENEPAFLPRGASRSVENSGSAPLCIIAVQWGPDLTDDIALDADGD